MSNFKANVSDLSDECRQGALIPGVDGMMIRRVPALHGIVSDRN